MHLRSCVKQSFGILGYVFLLTYQFVMPNWDDIGIFKYWSYPSNGKLLYLQTGNISVYTTKFFFNKDIFLDFDHNFLSMLMINKLGSWLLLPTTLNFFEPTFCWSKILTKQVSECVFFIIHILDVHFCVCICVVRILVHHCSQTQWGILKSTYKKICNIVFDFLVFLQTYLSSIYSNIYRVIIYHQISSFPS